MRIAIDTNRYRDFVDGDPGTLELFRTAAEIHVPFVVLAELRAGFQAGSAGQRGGGRGGKAAATNAATLGTFLDRARVRVLWPDQDTTHQYARLWNLLRARGTQVPTNDLWIAALVLQHGLLLCSRDAHFDRLPEIPRAG